MAKALQVTYYRYGNDDGTEATHTFKDATNTSPSHTWGFVPFLLRMTEQEVGGSAATNTAATFQYSKNAASWAAVTTASTSVIAAPVNAFVNGANNTKRLSGTGTFETSGAGCTEDGTSGGSANDIVASGNSETECGLQLVGANVVAGDVIQFRFTSPD